MTICERPTASTLPSSLAAGALPDKVIASLFDRNPLPMWIYDIQTLQFLAVNDSAIEHYGYSREDFLSMTIADIRPGEDVAALRGNLENVGDKLDRAGVWRHLREDGSLIFVEIISHPLDFMDRRSELVIAYDVTPRVAVESNLNRLLELERLIARISRTLNETDNLDGTIDDALRRMGSYSEASRAYLFRFDHTEKLTSNTHEWCADGVDPQINMLQDLPIDDFHWSMSQVIQGRTLSIPDVSQLPAEARKDQEILVQQQIKSLIMVPVHTGRVVSGFLGFDNVVAAEPWDEGAQRLLEVAAEVIGAAIQSRKDREALAFSAQQMESVMRSAEHFVFYRLAVDRAAEHNAQVEFVTDSLKNIVGMEPTAEFNTWFTHVHPDDLPGLEKANAVAVNEGTALDMTVRMQNPRHGGWRWIRAVSNPVRSADGEISHYNGILLNVTDLVETSQALKAERDFAQAVMNTVGALVVVLDREGRIVQFNRACQELTGYSFAEVRGRSVWEFLLLAQEREEVKKVFAELKFVGKPKHFENYWLSKDGRELLISWSNTAIVDEQGEMLFGIGTGIDITERRQAESAIRKLSSAVDQTANGIVIVDHQGIVEYVNPSFAEISGSSQDSLIGKPASFLGTPDSHDEAQARIWKHMLAGDNWRGELQQQDKNGKPCWMSITVSPIRSPDSQTTHYAVLVEDITRLKEAQEDLERLASFDTLTGLPNRRLFRDRLEHALSTIQRHGYRLALLYLDLDNFKRVNDSLGHDVGDILLREIAERLGRGVRDEDTVARLGGDEFVMLLQLTDDEYDVGVLARKLLQRVKQPIMAANHEVVITGSIGITFAPDDSMDPGVLMRNADLAMYRAKGRGRDGYGYFEGRMNVEVARRLSMEAELRQALKSGQIEPYFQPIVRLHDQRIVGFEALARWRHPSEGLVSPDRFIPVAEDCGLIIPIGEHLLECAAREIQSLRQAHADDLYVSVNLSARQAYDPKVFDMIVDVLGRTGLPAEALRLEITESLLMKDFRVTVKLIERLRERYGTRVAIDDFGTGYSSLSYLKRLPIDTLKIDRSFVTDIPDDENDVEITTAIIAMAQALKKDVVAEGVENGEQLEFLKSRGCQFAQGYLLGRPAPADTFLHKPLFGESVHPKAQA